MRKKENKVDVLILLIHLSFMAQLICTFKEFNDYIGPKIRNDVATITKQKKSNLKSICESCKNKSELDAAHKHGRSRKDIIKIVLDECETEDNRYIIQNLQKTIKAIKEQHFPIEDNFRFLCKTCHIQYDSQAKQTEIDNMQKTKRDINLSESPDKITHLNQRRKSQTNIDGNGVKEILCENEINSWRYKIGWTSIKNRMNILELIAKIEFAFDCYPIAFKSWYYHNRKDNNKQFSGIICHKQKSEICFRIDPNSFSIKDSQIIHGKRWFFPEGKEKRIMIIPENYDLIMKCLKYSYDIC